MFRILGMGNALTDVLIPVETDEMLHELRLPKGSMQLIDHSQFINIQKRISDFSTSLVCGGSAANTITGAARLGLQAGFIGKIHEDEVGKNYRRNLKSYGVSPLLLDDVQPSGRSLVFITPDGERTFATYLGAAGALRPDGLTPDMFSSYDLFYIEGYLVQDHELIQTALYMAKEAGLKTALDLASFNVVESNRDFLKSLIESYVDIVFANEEESKALTGMDPDDALAWIGSKADVSVVKLGSKGAMAMRGTEKVQIPATVSHCVDSTGAGDLFASGFLYGMSLDRTLTDCVRYGTITAGKVIEFIGPKMDNQGWESIMNDL